MPKYQGDVDAIGDLPDDAAPAAAAMAVSASGALSVSTTVVLTADEVDDARSRTPQYRAPGR
jgi:hypothetical protein